jgi:hypothetical protein
MRSLQHLELIEQTAPGTPVSGYGRLYVKPDGKIYFLNDSGTEYDLTQLGAGGSGVFGTGVVDFGVNGDTDAFVTITDASITPTSKVVASIVWLVSLSLGRDPDDMMLDGITLVCVPGSGTMDVYASAQEGEAIGKYGIAYSVG